MDSPTWANHIYYTDRIFHNYSFIKKRKIWRLGPCPATSSRAHFKTKLTPYLSRSENKSTPKKKKERQIQLAQPKIFTRFFNSSSSSSQSPKTLIPTLSLSSMEASVDRRKQPQAPTAGNGNANGVASAAEEEEEGELEEEEEEEEKLRLRLRANENHKPESYEDLQMQLEFSPLLFSSLEQYLPFNMLHVSRELKLQYMRHILLRYSPEGERARVSV